MKGNLVQKDGFTIIEVVLVLAIAGLIFLMIFIALPALNRSQRDAQRRDDVLLVLKKVKDYQTNNRGSLPSPGDWKTALSDYLRNDFVDPGGENYKLTAKNCGQSNLGKDCNASLGSSTQFPNGYTMQISIGATCDGEKAVATKNIRKIAIQYKLEGGGIYCANS